MLLQVLHSMLEKELWKKLPMAEGTVPDLARALQGQSQNGLLAKTGSSGSLPGTSAASQNGNTTTSHDGFDVWMAQGNPWRSTPGAEAASAFSSCLYFATMCSTSSMLWSA